MFAREYTWITTKATNDEFVMKDAQVQEGSEYFKDDKASIVAIGRL